MPTALMWCDDTPCLPIVHFHRQLPPVLLPFDQGLQSRSAIAKQPSQYVSASFLCLASDPVCVAYIQIVAADVIEYIGDVADLFKAVATALRPGGHFIVSSESLEVMITNYISLVDTLQPPSQTKYTLLSVLV